jgi:hypothetical protein
MIWLQVQQQPCFVGDICACNLWVFEDQCCVKATCLFTFIVYGSTYSYMGS